MNLIFDIGNTRVKTALFEGDKLMNTHYFYSVEEIKDWIKNIHYQQAIISSVANEEFTQKISALLHHVLIFNIDTPLPISNKYATPHTLGKDRLANAVAAYLLYPQSNTLIIDGGTCLKFDFINEKNEYLGGAIAPGLKMRFQALHTFTDKLPLINDLEEVDLIGTDTNSSILAGCYNGFKNEVLQTVSNYSDIYRDMKIILTGGDVSILEKMNFSQKNSIFADRWLTLCGLNEILEYNVKK